VSVALPDNLFRKLFPAFIRVDDNGQIVDLGPSLKRLLPEHADTRRIFDLFSLHSGYTLTRLDQITDLASVTLTSRTHQTRFRLRGIVHLQPGGLLFLVGHAPDIEVESDALPLEFSDFSPADPSIDLLIAAHMRKLLLDDATMLANQLEEKSREAEASARHDALTTLLNRRGFFEAFRAHIEKCQVSGDTFSVMVLDLDGFKTVNDIYGHTAGDTLLRTVSDRFKPLLLQGAIIGRLGGDEFGIVLPHCATEADAAAMGQSVCHGLCEPIIWQGGTIRPAASAGIALYPQHGNTLDALMERADFALYNSKLSTPGSVSLFHAEHEQMFRENWALEKYIMEATDEEFHLVYQPIVRAETGQVTGMEALARWTSPELGEVTPDRFIRAAERTGIVTRLTKLFIAKALKDVADWPDNISLSINLSAIDIASEETTQAIVRLINTAPVANDRIIFEVTETAIIRDQDQAKRALAQLTDIGVRVALDDFGTGYSSLRHLQQIPIDRLKIDRSFTKGLEHSLITENIMSFVIELCSKLEIECVVEGVSNARQLDLLRQAGAPLLQGFYFGRPMRARSIQAFLDTRATRSPVLPHRPALGFRSAS
jgi:diguanylate cyclase (GGDEF)-like protein